MLINIIVTMLILLVGIGFSVLQYKKNNSKVGVIFSIVATIALSITANLITDGIKQALPAPNVPVSNDISDESIPTIPNSIERVPSDSAEAAPVKIQESDVDSHKPEEEDEDSSRAQSVVSDVEVEKADVDNEVSEKEADAKTSDADIVSGQIQDIVLGTSTVIDGENNDSSQYAQSFVLGDTISGSISSEGDIDFYKFTFVNSGRVDFDISSYMKYYTLIIYDVTGTEIWYTDNNEYNSTVGFREDKYNIDLESGDYFLKVTGYKYGSSYASTGKYTIETTFKSANANEIEPNNRAEEANHISLGNTIQGLIGENDRFDFYEFTLPQSGRVCLDITSYMRYYTLIIYDATGAEIWYTDNNEYNSTVNFREDIYYIDLESGDFFLRVTGYKYGTSYASTGHYLIGTEFLSANANEIEPNNIAGEANVISLGNTVRGLIGVNDRFDFYEFTLSGFGSLTFDITSYMRYYCLTVYDATGSQLWYTDNNEFNETAGFRSDSYEIDLEKGTYYLRVTGYKYGTSYASTGNYEVTIDSK